LLGVSIVRALLVVEIDQKRNLLHHLSSFQFARQNTTKMKTTATLSAFIAAVELAQATVYLAGDSTMANNGANDGVTDG